MRQNNFNLLRFYFAFIVFIAHLIEITGVDSFKQFSPYFSTYISITGFFCISGFLITGSYMNTPVLKNYFFKRITRILPAYILVILLCSICLSTLSSFSYLEYFTHPQLFKYLVANLSFLNFIEPNLPGVFTSTGSAFGVNGALWTLKVEISFYVIIPFILYFSTKIKNKYWLFILIYALSVIYRNFMEWLSAASNNPLYTLLARQLPGFMSYFVCGMALYHYYDWFIRYKNKLFVCCLCLLFIERYLHMEILTPFALSVIVFTFAFGFKGLNKFSKQTDISYGIYIFHCPIINIAIDLGFFKHYNPFLVALIIVGIVLLTGYCSWHLIEKQFLKKTHVGRST